MPLTAALYAGGLLALMGLPPFGPFLSKLALVRAGFAAGRPWLMALVLALLAVAFVALVLHLQAMLYGTPRADVPRGEPRRAALVPLALCLAALVVLGVVVPAPLQALLDGAVAIAAPR
jgi:hydrogenase-4 component F